jgi:molecular chaperone DnaK
MKKIGLDFGTTNSILSYYQAGQIESYKLGGADGTNYIPSYISFDDDFIEIGTTARDNASDDSSIETYSKFKMLLGEKDQEKLANFGYGKDNRSVSEVVHTFIQELLKSYKEEHKEDIEHLVVTIPEIWLNDNLGARSELNSILNDLKLPSFQFISEPSAAGAYFLHQYKEKHQQNFNGHCLIFDYGGGTLDITLFNAQDQKIKILERTGQGHSKKDLGNAGVAYDNAVIQKAMEQTQETTLSPQDESYKPLLIEFELKKIRNKQRIEKAIEKYLKMGVDKEVFKVSEGGYTLSITPSLLIEVFDSLLKENILNALEDIEQTYKLYNIDTTDDTAFKIVLVGGFSSFWLSQKTVMEHFNTQTLSDKRFEQDLSKEDTALAISKGAALVANEMVQIDDVYPLSVGLIAYDIVDGYRKEVLKSVFKKGAKAEVNKKIFVEDFTVISAGKPTLYLDNGFKNYKIKLEHDVEALFPKYYTEENSWNFYFEMDENSFFYIYIVDKDGDTKKTELGKIIEDYNNTMIVK